jgi:integrase/recombinase XerC
MTYYGTLIRQYGDGEQTCCVCHLGLPAHETWPGARHPFCGKPECIASIKAKNPFSGKDANPGFAAQCGLYIAPNERKCEGLDCNNFVAEGLFDPRSDFLVCSGKCWVRRRTKGNRLLTCGCGCGEESRGRAERRPINGLYFKDSKHYGVYQQEQYFQRCWGVFQDIGREYLGGFAALHYRDLYGVRKHLGHFFEFLNREGINSLEAVTPPIVTQFLAWGAKNGRRGITQSVSPISTFFKWAIAMGHRKFANPVIPLIHRKRQTKRLPRPLEAEDMSQLWELLGQRGNARLRFAAAIGEEGGPRIGEICRIHLQDVDETGQRIFIRTPNKTMTERWIFFGEKTKKYLKEWLSERDPNCGHDLLLHNTRGDACTTQTLGQEFSRVLCKTNHGKKMNDAGFEKWSTHRLRHTMATNLVTGGADAATVMTALGHATFEAMCGYARVDTEVARRGYDVSMKRSREERQYAPRKKSLSPEEFLKLRRKVS